MKKPEELTPQVIEKTEKAQEAQEPKEESKEIPKDLADSVAALQGLINAHDLLQQGTFQGFQAKRVQEASDFIADLHRNMLDQAKNHPDAALIPALFQEGSK